MDSLPGAGAEILIDRVRRLVSKGKCGAQEWLDIMREAHQQFITTSATMMFGHVETIEERFEHLVKITGSTGGETSRSKGIPGFYSLDISGRRYPACQDSWRSQSDDPRRIYTHDCDESDYAAEREKYPGLLVNGRQRNGTDLFACRSQRFWQYYAGRKCGECCRRSPSVYQ